MLRLPCWDLGVLCFWTLSTDLLSLGLFLPMSDFLASPSTEVSRGLQINSLCGRGEESGLHIHLQPAALVTLLTKGRLTSQGLHLILCAREGGTWRGTRTNFLGINLKGEQHCGVVPVAGKMSLNIHALSLEK